MLTAEQENVVQQIEKKVAHLKTSADFSGYLPELCLEVDINALLKIICDLSALLDTMPLSFLSKNYATSEKGAAMNQVALQIIAIAKGFGANVTEVSTLLGIARAESNFNFTAVGDKGYSHGAFQAERQPGYIPDNQVQTAYKRIHEQMGYLKPIYNELSAFVLNDDLEVGKYHKAAWQMAPTSLIHWLKNVSSRIDMIKQNLKTTDLLNLPHDIVNALGGKLGIDDLISFAGAHGVNAAVLKSGQRDFVAFMTTQLNQYADVINAKKVVSMMSFAS